MAHARARRHADTEGHVPGDDGRRREHGLGGEVARAQVRGAEGDDLEGGPLAEVDGRPGDREAHHRAPGGRREEGPARRETAPSAGDGPAARRHHDQVQQEQDRAQVVGQGGAERRALEPHVQSEGEEPAEGDVGGRADDEDEDRGAEVALRLQEALEGLKGGVAREPDDAPAQEGPRHGRQVLLPYEEAEDLRGEQPHGRDGDAAQGHEHEHALHVQPDAVLVARPVGLRAQGVEGRRHALDRRVPHDVHRGHADAGRGEGVGVEVPRHEGRDYAMRVLEQVGGDEGEGVAG